MKSFPSPTIDVHGEHEDLSQVACIIRKCLHGLSIQQASKNEIASLTLRYATNHLTKRLSSQQLSNNESQQIQNSLPNLPHSDNQHTHNRGHHTIPQQQHSNDPQHQTNNYFQSLLFTHLFQESSFQAITNGMFDVRLIGYLVDSILPGVCGGWREWREEERYGNSLTSLTAAHRYLSIFPLFECEELANTSVNGDAFMVFLLQFIGATPVPCVVTPFDDLQNKQVNYRVGKAVNLKVYLKNLHLTKDKNMKDLNQRENNILNVMIVNDNENKVVVYEENSLQNDHLSICFTPRQSGRYVFHAIHRSSKNVVLPSISNPNNDDIEKGEKEDVYNNEYTMDRRSKREWKHCKNSPLKIDVVEGIDASSIHILPSYQPSFQFPFTNHLGPVFQSTINPLHPHIMYYLDISSADPCLFSYYIDGSYPVMHSAMRIVTGQEKVKLITREKNARTDFEKNNNEVSSNVKVFNENTNEVIKKDGSVLMLSYRPQKNGVYKVYVFYDNVQIRASPFLESINYKWDGGREDGENEQNKNKDLNLLNEDYEDYDGNDGKAHVKRQSRQSRQDYLSSVQVAGRGLEHGYAGHWCSFNVGHIPSSNQHSASAIWVSISGPSEVIVEVKETKQDFEVSYRALSVGVYMVCIKVGCYHISNSPYFIHIRPLTLVYELEMHCASLHDDHLHKLALRLYGCLGKSDDMNFDDLLLIRRTKMAGEGGSVVISSVHLLVIDGVGDIKKIRIFLRSRISDSSIALKMVTLKCAYTKRVWSFDFNNSLDKYNNYFDRYPSKITDFTTKTKNIDSLSTSSDIKSERNQNMLSSSKKENVLKSKKISSATNLTNSVVNEQKNHLTLSSNLPSSEQMIDKIDSTSNSRTSQNFEFVHNLSNSHFSTTPSNPLPTSSSPNQQLFTNLKSNHQLSANHHDLLTQIKDLRESVNQLKNDLDASHNFKTYQQGNDSGYDFERDVEDEIIRSYDFNESFSLQCKNIEVTKADTISSEKTHNDIDRMPDEELPLRILDYAGFHTRFSKSLGNLENLHYSCISSTSSDEFHDAASTHSKALKHHSSLNDVALYSSGEEFRLNTSHLNEESTEAENDCDVKWKKNNTVEEDNNAKSKLQVLSTDMKDMKDSRCSYRVITKTGTRLFSGTDADAFITLVGDLKESDEIELSESNIPGVKFARDKVDSFNLDCTWVGKLQKIRISHNNCGLFSASWFLEGVVVVDMTTLSTFIFPLHHCIPRTPTLHSQVELLPAIQFPGEISMKIEDVIVEIRKQNEKINALVHGEGLNFPRRNKINSFKVEIKTKERRRNLWVFVNDSNGDECGDVSLFYEGAGLYSVHFRCESLGRHQLSILWGGDHVHGSPFTIEVT